LNFYEMDYASIKMFSRSFFEVHELMCTDFKHCLN